jgi:RNA polymerase sigma-70 factor (ECF subfamily)
MPTTESNIEPALDLAELFRHYYPRMYNYLRYRVSSVEDVEDLISAIFEQAYTHRHQYDAAKGAFSTWLFRIARNELVSFYRKQQRRSAWESDAEVPVDLATTTPLPETQLIQQEAMLRLLQGLSQLSERDQEIISLKFAGRLKNKEIGEIMEMKEKTVSVALLRAARRLREYMEARP